MSHRDIGVFNSIKQHHSTASYKTHNRKKSSSGFLETFNFSADAWPFPSSFCDRRGVEQSVDAKSLEIKSWWFTLELLRKCCPSAHLSYLDRGKEVKRGKIQSRFVNSCRRHWFTGLLKGMKSSRQLAWWWGSVQKGCNLSTDWRRLKPSFVVIKPHFYVCCPAPQPLGSRVITKQPYKYEPSQCRAKIHGHGLWLWLNSYSALQLESMHKQDL